MNQPVPSTNANVPDLGNGSRAVGRYRWTICMLVFFATTVNYLDRAVISLLKGRLEEEFLWTETDYSNIVVAFQISYAIGLLIAGRIIDKVGTRIGYAVFTTLWSIAAIGHAAVSSTLGFIIARSALGLTEAGNFPAAVKAIAEWFPKKERAFATGIFNSGTNIGAIIAPLTVPLIAVYWGWKWAFILTGLIGFIWLVLWLIHYDRPARHKKVTTEELNYINSDVEDQETKEKADEKVRTPWIRFLFFRQTWAFIVGKFMADPVWWFYLFWLPAFLKAEYGIEGTAVTLPVTLVFGMASIGSIFGGWLPLYFIQRNWPVFRARKTAMLIYAFFVVPVVFAQLLGSINMWYAVIVIGLAASAHQAWSANVFTLVSDMFPKRTVASVTGIGGMAGSLGGILIASLAGGLFDHYKALGSIETGYYIMFFICGSAYLLAWVIMHFLVPRMKPVDLQKLNK